MQIAQEERANAHHSSPRRLLVLFFSNENDEPPHIHVEFGDKLAKYWLEPVELASSQRVRSHKLGSVRRLVVEHRTEFLKAWHEHFDA